MDRSTRVEGWDTLAGRRLALAEWSKPLTLTPATLERGAVEKLWDVSWMALWAEQNQEVFSVALAVLLFDDSGFRYTGLFQPNPDSARKLWLRREAEYDQTRAFELFRGAEDSYEYLTSPSHVEARVSFVPESDCLLELVDHCRESLRDSIYDQGGIRDRARIKVVDVRSSIRPSGESRQVGSK